MFIDTKVIVKRHDSGPFSSWHNHSRPKFIVERRKRRRKRRRADKHTLHSARKEISLFEVQTIHELHKKVSDNASFGEVSSHAVHLCHTLCVPRGVVTNALEGFFHIGEILVSERHVSSIAWDVDTVWVDMGCAVG